MLVFPLPTARMVWRPWNQGGYPCKDTGKRSSGSQARESPGIRLLSSGLQLLRLWSPVLPTRSENSKTDCSGGLTPATTSVNLLIVLTKNVGVGAGWNIGLLPGPGRSDLSQIQLERWWSSSAKQRSHVIPKGQNSFNCTIETQELRGNYRSRAIPAWQCDISLWDSWVIYFRIEMRIAWVAVTVSKSMGHKSYSGMA